MTLTRSPDPRLPRANEIIRTSFVLFAIFALIVLMVFAFKDEGGVHERYTVDEDGENVSEISSVEFLNA